MARARQRPGHLDSLSARARGTIKTVTETEFVSPPSAIELRFTPAALDVRAEVVLDAARRRVFEAFLHVAAWWPDRARAGSAVVLEPRVGGRFFEDCDDGCGILLGNVSRLVMPGEFAIEGSFGLDQPVCALWNVRLDAEGHDRTVLRGRFRAFGALDVLDDATRSVEPAAWDARYAALRHYLDA
jgi:hypothetical protein